MDSNPSRRCNRYGRRRFRGPSPDSCCADAAPPIRTVSRTTPMTSYNLTHLKQLEAESIHIIREVAAEFTTSR